MVPKVYLETTVVSYLVARPSRDVVIAGHQQVTRDWWRLVPSKFEAVASQLVIQEAGAGDEEAARDRLSLLEKVPLLAASPEALELARRLVTAAAIPQEAAEDALHLAIATTNGIDYW